MTLEVVDPGLLTSVQDTFGRRRWRHLGVPVGGAADPWSATLANRLAGNPDGAALLEVTLTGATLRLLEGAIVGVSGGLAAAVDGVPLAPDSARAVGRGSVLALSASTGARGYVAIAGGLDVPEVLGSRATDLRTGFGGHHGRPLVAGDRLALGTPRSSPTRWLGRRPPHPGPLRVLWGLHGETLDALLGLAFTVSTQADRTGIRMAEGVDGGGEVPSMGIPLGAVQLPPDGRPIVMLSDRPVTGGYRVPAVVIRADLGRAAQLRTGDAIAFVPVSPEAALEAGRLAEAELDALEPLEERWGDELGWAGSHR